ncbi:MAG: hypothetical protein LBU28_03435 [Spirochaetaceae bacterium]|jgi:hypothetical protein|nr:hypothetical protein [Spirochaetaceae bacterium]
MLKIEQAKIDASRVRNMLEKLPEIRSQLAGYYDDLRKIECEVYAFNKKFNAAIRTIYEVEHFCPGEDKTIEKKPKNNIIIFPKCHTEQSPAAPPGTATVAPE